jgi:hypothetical protein
MISSNELSELYSRCENALKIIKERMEAESVSFNERNFKALEKMSEINMTYLVFLSEIIHGEQKRYIVDDEYVSIIKEFCETVENL